MQRFRAQIGSPPSPLPLVQNQAHNARKTSALPSLVIRPAGCTYMINRCIPFHGCQILSPSKTGFIVSAHRLTNITLLPLVQATLYFQGESPTYILNEDTNQVIRAIGVSHTACKDEFRQNLRFYSLTVFTSKHHILRSMYNNAVAGNIIAEVLLHIIYAEQIKDYTSAVSSTKNNFQSKPSFQAV